MNTKTETTSLRTDSSWAFAAPVADFREDFGRTANSLLPQARVAGPATIPDIPAVKCDGTWASLLRALWSSLWILPVWRFALTTRLLPMAGLARSAIQPNLLQAKAAGQLLRRQLLLAQRTPFELGSLYVGTVALIAATGARVAFTITFGHLIECLHAFVTSAGIAIAVFSLLSLCAAKFASPLCHDSMPSHDELPNFDIREINPTSGYPLDPAGDIAFASIPYRGTRND